MEPRSAIVWAGRPRRVLTRGVAAGVLAWAALAGGARGQTNVYFGDTHVHTSYSIDAYQNENADADPDTAYRYARGLPVVHPFHRAQVRIDRPLDFLVVADHGEYLGVPVLVDPVTQPNEIDPGAYAGTAWNAIMDAAEANYFPGSFTTFLGWEWSSQPKGANLHRVVIMREGKSVGQQFLPYTSFDGDDPEDLWGWLESTSRKTGASFLAIPHGSNISQGRMFPDANGGGFTAGQARTRARWEPIVEVTQIRGDAETHPTLSPGDAFADFETYGLPLAGNWPGVLEPPAGAGSGGGGSDRGADYVRSALERGLVIDSLVGANPYKFGLIGSTGAHSGLSSAREDDFWGEFAIDSTPETKSVEIVAGGDGWDMSAGGLAAVWATDNTREAIFDAFMRREVYATTGSRMTVRFFGGWSFVPGDAQAPDLALVGYQKGVPMGADLAKGPRGQKPSFLIDVARDPLGANLDRIQVVKGWTASGQTFEKVYNVALSDGRLVSPPIPPVGDTVDPTTGSYTNTIGDPQLTVVWTDQEFVPTQRAFWYVRVLEIPTPRHSLLDAVALEGAPPAGHPTSIQERAYTSPIWYTPPTARLANQAPSGTSR